MTDYDAIKLAVADALAEFEAGKVLPLEVRRVRLEPGDRLILRTPYKLPHESAARLEAAFSELFPTASKVLVLEDGLDLEVVSAAAAS